MQTLKDIRAAAVNSAAANINIPDNNLELNKACLAAFEAVGGNDSEDYDIFERYWRAARQQLKSEEAQIAALGDKPSPSAAKAAKKQAAMKAAADTVAAAAKVAVLFLLSAFCFLFSGQPARAQVLAGSGITVAPNSTTNLTSLGLVGTFYLNPVPLVVNNSSGITNPGLCPLGLRLTFDGSNYFTLPQTITNSAGSNWANATVTWTNLALPVYCSLSISNGQGQGITDLTAVH